MGLCFLRKKYAVGTISFLGMQLSEVSYSPGNHIAEELIKFPDQDLSVKQIQQFLGIVNCLREFVPNIAQDIHPLSKMLKKNPPPWSSSQTTAVQNQKKKLQNLPSLHIPSTGKRVLQTDASEKYWSAVLFEELNNTRHLCAYASGRFKDSEIHYHSTFKEILAVKNGIKKFHFYLIGHHLMVETDMSSFPKMLQFKQKMVPQLQ